MILVTGATGLVGSHLVMALLEKEPTVRAMYRTEASIEKVKALFDGYGKTSLFQNIDWIQADITDVTTLDAAFDQIQQVYHCAALISFDPADEALLRKVNIEGTANVVNYCIDYQIRKLCHVSSIAALGDLKEHENIIDENSEWNPEFPHSDYAISKYGAEMEVWRGKEEGLEVCMVNPGVIIGPGFWENGSGKLFQEVAGRLLFYTSGSSGFISVHDVVKCLLYCMENVQGEERFCLVAENLSFKSVLQTMADALGVPPPKFLVSRTVTEIGWRLDWIRSVIFRKKRTLSKLSTRSLHQKSRYSSAKIRSIYPEPFQQIDQCILACAQWYQKK